MKNVFRWFGTTLLALLLAMLPAQPCSAQCTETLPLGVIAVDLSSQVQNPDGRSWECAFDDLNDALDHARDPRNEVTQVWVKADTYTLASASDTFELVDGVWLLGGFAGTETNRKNANPYINETILSGNLSGGGNAYHVVTADNPMIIDFELLTRLDGFIIKDGDASGDNTNPNGGGLLVLGNEETNQLALAVSRCRFENNNASSGGAVAVHRNGGVTITTLVVDLINCEFTENTAGDGGAVWVSDAKAVITNSLFVDNDATSHGGALHLVITDDSEYEGCEKILFFGDQDSEAIVNNCTFSLNEAGVGGAIWAPRGIRFLNVTGSVFWENIDGSSSTVEREQIAQDFYCDPPDSLSVTYSCIETDDPQTPLAEYDMVGNIDDNPLFAGAGSGNFRLTSTSPCVDAGDLGPEFPQDDLDFNDDGNTGEKVPDLHQLLRVRNCIVDMGCYEHECNCEADLVTSGTFEPPPDGEVNGADLAFLLGEWGPNPGSPADIVTSATFQPPPDGIVDGADLAVLLGSWGVCRKDCGCE